MAIDQKIADQLKFEEKDQPEQKINSIMDSQIFAKKAIDDRLPKLYYLIHQKGEIYAKNTQEPIKEIAHLRQLLKKYYIKNSDKPTATFPPINKGALPLPMTAQFGAKVAPPITLRKSALIKRLQPICGHISKRINPSAQVCYGKWHQKPRSTF